MKFQKKSVSKLALTDLLRRKKTNLAKYLSDNGILSYELLLSRCFSIGVIAPSEDQFLKARGDSNIYNFSSPTEGIVVLNPVLEPLFHTHEEAEAEEVIHEFGNDDNADLIFLGSLTADDDEPKQKSKRKKKNFTDNDA